MAAELPDIVCHKCRKVPIRATESRNRLDMEPRA